MASCRRPNATVDAKELESCLLRPGIRLGLVVSAPAATAGGMTTGFVTESTPLPSGGGAEQLKFGTDQSGLTPTQLAQVLFANPAGMPGGNYPATILATGEVVPGPRPTISMTHSLNNLVISWSGSYQLFTSTNVLGPYTIINGATSPHTNSFNEPHRFFVLRSP